MYFIGIDVGIFGIKIILIDLKGKILVFVIFEYFFY